MFEGKSFEERLQIMRRSHLYRNCFKYGHIAVGCLTKSACQVDGCTRKHHTLLHPPLQQDPMDNRASVTDAEVQVSSSTPVQAGQTNSTSTGGGNVCLRLLPVKVRSRDTNKTVETYALLDNGSDVSLCDKSLASELGVQRGTRTFYLTTQEKEESPKVGQEISLTMEALDGTDHVEVNRLWTVDKLNASSRTHPRASHQSMM